MTKTTTTTRTKQRERATRREDGEGSRWIAASAPVAAAQGRAVRAALAGEEVDAVKVRGAILDALGLASAPTLPEWLTVAGAPEELIHLAPPLFRACVQDNDDFYHECEEEALVYTGRGKAVRLRPCDQDDEDEEDDEGDEDDEISLPDRDLKRCSAYDPEGVVVLAAIRWFEAAPGERRPFDALMKAAMNAALGRLPVYGAAEAPSRPRRRRAPRSP
jgi:hypothetical protein